MANIGSLFDKLMSKKPDMPISDQITSQVENTYKSVQEFTELASKEINERLLKLIKTFNTKKEDTNIDSTIIGTSISDIQKILNSKNLDAITTILNKKEKDKQDTLKILQEKTKNIHKVMITGIKSIDNKLNDTYFVAEKISNNVQWAFSKTFKFVKSCLPYITSKDIFSLKPITSLLMKPATFIKNMSKTLIKTIAWPIYAMGKYTKKLLMLGWKAIKTIFLTLPYGVLKTAVSIAGKGIDKFMEWTGGLFLKIFDFPWIFVLGIPFILFVVPKVFDAVWGFVSKNVKYLWKFLDKHLQVSKIWNEWIMPGIDKFWTWLTGKPFNAWWKAQWPTIKGYIRTFFEFIFGKELVSDFIQTSFELWDWLKQTWEDIKWVWNASKIVFGFLFIRNGLRIIQSIIVNAFRLVKFVVNIGVFIAKQVGKIISFVAKKTATFGRFIAKRIAGLIGVIKSTISKFIPNFIKRAVGFMGKLSGFIFKKLFGSIFGKIGMFSIAKIIGRGLLKFIPFIGLALDLYEIGKAMWYAAKVIIARADARETAEKWVDMNQKFLASMETDAEISSQQMTEYTSMGMTPLQAKSFAKRKNFLDTLARASVYLGSQFNSIATSALNDPHAEQTEVDLGFWIEKQMANLYNLISNTMKTGFSTSLPSLKNILSYAENIINQVKLDWASMKQSAGQRIDSGWFSNKDLVIGVDSSIQMFSEFIKRYSQYVKELEIERNEKAFSKFIPGMQVDDLKDIEISGRAADLYKDYQYDALRDLDDVLKPEAKQKLLKAIQLSIQNGPSAEKYIMAAIQKFTSNRTYINTVFSAIQSASKYYIEASRNSISIPSNFTDEDLQRFEFGGVLAATPNKTKVIKLNTEGKEYIIKQLDDIKIPEIEGKDQKQNITIIEEENIMVESYELYAMDKMSKGILGV